MNMFGNLFGAVSGILVTGIITKSYPGDNGILICFAMYGSVYIIGVFLWLMIDASQPVVPDDQEVAGNSR